MNNLIVKPVGKVVFQNEMPLILLEKPYRSALEGLDGFSHIQIFWWFDACDNEASRGVLKVSSPYRTKGPAHLEAAVVGEGEFFGEILQNLLAGGKQGVFKSGALLAVLVPPAHTPVGAVDEVQIGHAAPHQEGVGLGTASGVDKDGVVSSGEADIVVPGEGMSSS